MAPFFQMTARDWLRRIISDEFSHIDPPPRRPH